MLVRLLYASRAAQPVTSDTLAAILRQSKANNPERGLTGVLCFSDNDGHGNSIFLQVLEGSRNAVSAAYNRIAADPRHTEVVLLSFEEITERRFAHWSMGEVNLSRLNPALLLKYSETATLNPYTVSGAASMALFEELVATAAIMGKA
jgi:hypothetical protein